MESAVGEVDIPEQISYSHKTKMEDCLHVQAPNMLLHICISMYTYITLITLYTVAAYRRTRDDRGAR